MDNAARPGVSSGFLTPCMKKLQRDFLMVNIISVINKAALFKLEGLNYLDPKVSGVFASPYPPKNAKTFRSF